MEPPFQIAESTFQRGFKKKQNDLTENLLFILSLKNFIFQKMKISIDQLIFNMKLILQFVYFSIGR